MHRFTIHSRWLPDVTCAIPSRRDELSGPQLEKIAWLSLLPHRGSDLAKLFFMVLCESLPWWKRWRVHWFFIAGSSLEDKADLLTLVREFRKDQEPTDQKLPKIRLKLKKIGYTFVLLYGPSSKLGNASFWEFVEAEKYYLNYLEAAQKQNVFASTAKQSPNQETATPPRLSYGAGSASSRSDAASGIGHPTSDIQYLNKLVATLYREPRTDYRPKIDTDIRIPLTNEGFKWRLRLVERMPLETKIAILMWFESCRRLIIRSFPVIFQPPEEGHKKKRSAPEKLSARERNGQHWLEMISELAGSMDRYDAIGNTPVWTAFMDISHKIKKNDEAKRQAAQSAARTRKR